MRVSDLTARPEYHFSVRGYTFNQLRAFNEGSVALGIDVAFTRDEPDGLAPHYFFRSRHLDVLDDIAEVWARGEHLLTLFHGAYRLATLTQNASNLVEQPRFEQLFDFARGINTNALYALNGATASVTAFATSSQLKTWMSPDDTDVAKQVGVEERNNPIARALFLAQTTPDVYALLEAMGQRLDYGALFSICDTLAYYVNAQREKAGEKKLKDHRPIEDLYLAAGTSDEEYKRFTRTANNYHTIGIAARHGLTEDRAYKAPLSLVESQYLVTSLVRAYLTKYYDVDYPPVLPVAPEQDWDIDLNDF